MLKVCNEVLSEKYHHTFVCEVETILGDCDDYQTVEIELGNYEANVLSLDSYVNDLEQLFVLLMKFDREVHNYDDYTSIDLFNKMFPDSKGAVEWPSYEGDFLYGYENHSYYWYDDMGRKYYCEYAKDGE